MNKFVLAVSSVFGVLFAMLIIAIIQQSFFGAAVLVMIVIAAIGSLIGGVIYFVYWIRKTKPRA